MAAAPAVIVVVSTGGTIAMRPDPATGKLVPATTLDELLESLAWLQVAGDAAAAVAAEAF